MSWIFLIIAGLFEIFGVVALNQFKIRANVWTVLGLMVTFGGSLSFLYLAMRGIEMGTAYAVWTGIGAAGGAIVGIIWYGESRSYTRILFVTLIIIAVVGLKIVS
ncbi:multidrug efflux SMR transporter [Periweissella cryptocerci]|uniref:Multidrug efflux SMR transporter n=1 Tax=Periweissella cryptocerci TaxID=2506420 RepID=A0A4P6YWA6_9LACO|nr:multidrug efflux SMR transporter [Periweissella cryptocerci]QBO37066.1 multidrug efflux SMR transporter [Periweissella cryptocerci]